ncbi:hypothetical protein AB0K05_24755 [Nonomuraea sp. NPDC049486]|uniref:hypothetical protein n=1 Tax=Nonomuraea sp. NPDC049486 TaxID=3155773 RepID=UPI00341A705C
MAAFESLQPGQLARIRRMHARDGEQPPPIVVVESFPEPCGDGGCQDLRVTARDPVTGRELIYHRPPGFDAEFWGVASPTPSLVTELKEQSA